MKGNGRRPGEPSEIFAGSQGVFQPVEPQSKGCPSEEVLQWVETAKLGPIILLKAKEGLPQKIMTSHQK